MREYARSLKFVLLIVVVVFILTSGVLFYFGSAGRRRPARRGGETLSKQGVQVSDEALRQAHRQRHDQVRAAWAYADVYPAMAAVQVAAADLEPFVKGHQPQFSQPERRRLQY